MIEPNAFPAISPEMARGRFLTTDVAADGLFKTNFNQFIIGTLETSRFVIRLPVPPSRTSNHALIFLIDGQVDLTIGHQPYTLRAQELVVIPSLQIFSLNIIREGSQGYMCFFSPELLRNTTADTDFNFLKLTGTPYLSLSALQTEFINNLLTRITAEYMENGSAKTDIIRPYLMALLAEINRAYAGTSSIRSDAGDRLVQGFMDLLNSHIRQKRFVADYADLLNISPNHLNKVVKSRTGQSPSVWIDERIVLEAKVWLFQSDLTIAQIAAELGFDDQSAFGKLFRKYAGSSPTAFRSQYVRKND